MNITSYRSMIQRYDISYDMPNKKQLQINDNMNTIFPGTWKNSKNA